MRQKPRNDPHDPVRRHSGAVTGLSFEEMLVAVGRDKNKECFVALFEHFAPRVKSFLMQGGMNADAADELAQETMLTLWDKAPSFNPVRARASTWIFTIARNKKIDALRRGGRSETVDFNLQTLEDESVKPGEDLEREQERAAIATAFEKLPEDQRELVQKAFIEGRSHSQIAAQTNLPLGTVKSRLRLALERLRGEKTLKEFRP
jgi:RNA polymerase sigma factor (sigma-70 family)